MYWGPAGAIVADAFILGISPLPVRGSRTDNMLFIVV